MLRGYLVSVLLVALSGTASAQPSKPTGKPPTSPTPSPTPTTPTSPTTPPPPKWPEVIEPGPYVRFDMQIPWKLTASIYLNQNAEYIDGEGNRMTYPVNFPFETVTVVFPVLSSTASATMYQTLASGALRINDRDACAGSLVLDGSKQDPTGGARLRPTLMRRERDGGLYQGGVHLAAFATGEIGKQTIANRFRLNVEMPMVCSNTIFDERAAMKVGWPTGPWPEHVAATFLPQQWIDYSPMPDGRNGSYDPAVFESIVKAALRGRDTRSVTPVMLAKMLLGHCVDMYTITPNDFNYRLTTSTNKSGEIVASGGVLIQGLRMSGAATAAMDKKGTKWDLIALTAAVYRKAGLPTRTVVGYDRREKEEREKGRSLQSELCAWIEFYLYDEVNKTGNWIPVDVLRFKESCGKAPPLTSTYRWFGTNDVLNSIMPFAFQFQPPTDVRGYNSPAFWGWQMTPGVPTRMYTAISFSGAKMPTPSKAQIAAEERNKKIR